MWAAIAEAQLKPSEVKTQVKQKHHKLTTSGTLAKTQIQ